MENKLRIAGEYHLVADVMITALKDSKPSISSDSN
jgi:hypothetical protein